MSAREILSAVIIFMLIAYYVRKMPRPKALLLLFAAAGDDEDMKIAGGDFSRHSDTEDGAEDAARQFLMEKEAGNIAKARDLGKIYAKALIEYEGGYSETQEISMLETHHRLLLCSYAVNRVIAEHSPNSIIAHTSLNVFYNDIETESPALYSHISDMAAFSLYILSGREGGSDGETGRIYAKLCGFEGDKAKISEGEETYRSFYGYCAGKMDETEYENITLSSIQP